jgi:hypothetical protein
VVECGVELIDRRRPEGVAHLGPVERDADSARRPGPVIGDVVEVETRYDIPRVGVEDLRDHPAIVGVEVRPGTPTAFKEGDLVKSTRSRCRFSVTPNVVMMKVRNADRSR